MRLNLTSLAVAVILPTAVFAQDSIKSSTGSYPNSYTSGSANVSPFTQESKRFNDWAISAGAGIPLMHSADLNSLKEFGAGQNLIGWSGYLSVDKAISHAFGLKLQYDKGETRQGAVNTKDHVASPNGDAGRTQYDAISILGDLNFSNLLRRVDNKSPYRWALHGYAGVGTLAYRAYRQNAGASYNQQLVTEIKPFKAGSIFGQGGAGLKYRASRSLDLEARGMYVYTGDDTFDGARTKGGSNSDNFINLTLGATLNLGKHESHVFWHDPLQEMYYRADVLAAKSQDIEVCKSGDADNDGVCDDWDRQLDTPQGARVDGAGVALDVDLDGVIDLYDKCVTVPGPVENNGCPTNSTSVVGDNTRVLEGIEFDFNSDRILPSNTPILNNAANYINSSAGAYNVIGGADTTGTAVYNQRLSERRANTVKNYLIQNGVSSGKIDAIGRGETNLKYPECNPASKCPEWKNRANRRVYFEAK
ncbi:MULTISPECIES: OmpA family protein [Chryseobacterium]|uniref:Outer membrane porin F n=1 Tax=Chryseobacterium salivictor TaxID=2547600 RepID=A0A4P6ZFN6_9FLAO|nr:MULTISPECIES: OmpA family protein [Chryseobacterium]MDQ0477978.1 OOP family OmpA-OmpF porin [Chryseobacterium sp. MDT2-18]QBO58450.1 Outer membrane porin F [Chryseobacterium salivictor]